MSFGSILSIARTAVTTHQAAVQVTSQNVANASTPGYSRQRTELSASVPFRTPQGAFGTGVQISTVSRSRDELLDASYRRDAARAAGSSLSRDLLGSIESVYNEPSESGLSSTLDAFWSSWGDLANAPTSASAKAVVRQRAEQVIDRLHTMSGQLGDVQTDVRARLSEGVAAVNAAAKEIADLNERIVAAEVGGASANDLRDVRDRAIDGLTKYGPVRVIEAPNGSVAVALGTTTVVDANNPRVLELKEIGGQTAIALAGSARAIPPTGGALGSLLDTLNVDVPDAQARLDAVAKGLVETVNGLHRRGYSASAEAADPSRADWTNADPTLRGSRADFFDASAGSLTAATISLSSLVAADSSAISASYTQGAVGDNKLALAMAGLRDQANVVGTQSIGAYYQASVSSIATRVNAATTDASAADALTQLADSRRQAVSGVSTDEELIQLMRHQQAYVAATRLIQVADEMTQELLSIVK